MGEEVEAKQSFELKKQLYFYRKKRYNSGRNSIRANIRRALPEKTVMKIREPSLSLAILVCLFLAVWSKLLSFRIHAPDCYTKSCFHEHRDYYGACREQISGSAELTPSNNESSNNKPCRCLMCLLRDTWKVLLHNMNTFPYYLLIPQGVSIVQSDSVPRQIYIIPSFSRDPPSVS